MKKEMEPGPLVRAIDESRNSIARRHALIQYRDNLSAAGPQSRALWHGGLFFGVLGGVFFVLVIVNIWAPMPGGGLLGWAATGLNVVSLVLNRRSMRVSRRAIAGWPVCPS